MTLTPLALKSALRGSIKSEQLLKYSARAVGGKLPGSLLPFRVDQSFKRLRNGFVSCIVSYNSVLYLIQWIRRIDVIRIRTYRSLNHFNSRSRADLTWSLGLECQWSIRELL
ncbi:hypothetical protein Tco_0072175 [Tanacetum coccineum]